MLYRVVWTVSQDEDTSTHEYIASLDDAWELWYWLTSRSVMEPEYYKRLLEQKESQPCLRHSARHLPSRLGCTSWVARRFPPKKDRRGCTGGKAHSVESVSRTIARERLNK